MTEVQSTTQEIIDLLEQALVATEEAPPLSPAEKERIRREQDEYDYDPPGYDPDEPTGNEPYYEEGFDEEEHDEDDFVDEADIATDHEIADAYLDEIEAAYDADPDAVSDQDVAVEDLIVSVKPPPSPMIVSVLQENLKKALDLVVSYIPSYPPLPVLGHVLLEAEDSRLKISATDLETSISVWIGARREQPGAITIPAKTMKKYIALLSPERIDFRVDVSTWIMNVRCGIQTGELRGIDANEFPPIRHNENRWDFTIVAEALLRMLDTVIKGVAKEQNRPILCGVNMRLEKGQLSLASADGYRVTVERLPVDYAGEKEDLTLPGDAMKKLLRVLRGHKDAEVGITLPSERNSVTFTLPNIAVSSQLLEGRFPDYASIIPRSYVTKAIFYANDMRIALQRAEVFAKDNANSCTLSITPAFNPGEPALLTLSAKSPEQGQTEAMLDATAEGEKTAWSANYKFMLEAVESYRKDSERLVIHTNGPENPAVIRPEYYPERDGEVNAHNAGSITVIMPMSK